MSGVISPFSIMFNPPSPLYSEVRIGAMEGVKLSTSCERSMYRLVSLVLAVETINRKIAETSSVACETSGCGVCCLRLPGLERHIHVIARVSTSLKYSAKRLKSGLFVNSLKESAENVRTNDYFFWTKVALLAKKL